MFLMIGLICFLVFMYRWAFGVLIYEMLAGYPPFYDDGQVTLFDIYEWQETHESARHLQSTKWGGWPALQVL